MNRFPGHHTDLQLLVLYRSLETIDTAATVSIKKLSVQCGLSRRKTIGLLDRMSGAALIDIFKTGDCRCPVQLYLSTEPSSHGFFHAGEFRLRVSFAGKLFLKMNRAKIVWDTGRKVPARTSKVARELLLMPLPPGPMIRIKPKSVVNGPTFVTNEYVGLLYRGRNYKCHVDEFAEAIGGPAVLASLPDGYSATIS